MIHEKEFLRMIKKNGFSKKQWLEMFGGPQRISCKFICVDDVVDIFNECKIKSELRDKQEEENDKK